MFKIKLHFQQLKNKIFLKKRGEKTSKTVDTSSLVWILFRMFSKMVILVFFGALILFPFYYMIAVSLMDNDVFTKTSEFHLVPKKLHWSNFTEAFQEGYWQAVMYSFLIASVSIVLKLIITLMMGYAFSMRKWWGKKLLWYFFLALLFIPEVALMSGQYKMIVKLEWHYGSRVLIGLFIPFIASVFSALMFKNAFETIPDMTKKACMIDGVTGIRYFVKVALPLITPTIWVVTILTAFAAWNSYMWPSLLLQGHDIQLIPTWVFKTGVGIGKESRLIFTIRMAGAVLAIVPMFIVFALMKNKIMNAVSRQGNAIKG